MLKSLKKCSQALIPPVLFPIIKETAIFLRDMGGRRHGVPIPWSPGYRRYKQRMIRAALSDQKIIEKFRLKEPLPDQYGYGVDERIIEYPWLFANFRECSGNVLDAGSILNHELIAEQPFVSGRNIHILTLAPEGESFLQPQGVSYFYGDLRNIPIKDNYYDAVICLSTLEHIGCDNTIYSNNKKHEEKALTGFVQALQEFRRVLKKGGSLFISVPFGKYQFFGSFQQFDISLLENAINAFGKAEVARKDFYKYGQSGWQIAGPQDCADGEYVQWIIDANWDPSPSSVPRDADTAAGARAVACVHLMKKFE